MHAPVARHHHVATPHYSGLAWLLVLVPFILTGGVMAFVLSMPGTEAAPATESAVPPTIAKVEPVEAPVSEPSDAPPIAVSSSDTDATPTTGSSADVEAPRDAPVQPKPRASAPKKPTGPVITVKEAQKQLEPKVLACMRQTKTHDLLGYMGNKTVGPVTVLKRSTTRVDGRLTNLTKTKLGRCMNEAGSQINTRAFKSNYVRFQLVNDAVPDPLGHLPAKADRKQVAAIIEGADPKILDCARKHGEQGLHEVFMFTIDGPTGEVMVARGLYGKRGFHRCANKVHRALTFPKVQQHEIKHTHKIDL